MRKSSFLICSVVLFYVFIEILSYIGLAILKSHNIIYLPADRLSENQRDKINKLLRKGTNYIVSDSDLGWNIKKNGYGNDLGCSKGTIKSNSSGIRSNREYDLIQPANILTKQV